MSLPPWDDLIAGKGCPFCGARPDRDDYIIKIKEMRVSTLCLQQNQVYKGYCLLIFNARHVTGLEQLTAEEYVDYTADLKDAADAISKAFQPDHMNYATLGNVIPHLHYHIIPRYKDDPRWQAPIWMSRSADMHQHRLPEDEYPALVAKIRQQLPV